MPKEGGVDVKRSNHLQRPVDIRSCGFGDNLQGKNRGWGELLDCLSEHCARSSSICLVGLVRVTSPDTSTTPALAKRLEVDSANDPVGDGAPHALRPPPNSNT